MRLNNCQVLSRLVILLPFSLVSAGLGQSSQTAAKVMTTAVHAEPPAVVTSGDTQLTFPLLEGGTFGLKLHSSRADTLDATTATPVTIFVCQGVLDSESGSGSCTAADQNSDPLPENTFKTGYSSVFRSSSTQVTALARVKTTNGSVFNVTDVYAPTEGGALTAKRFVEVSAIGESATPDVGFNSQFSLSFAGPARELSSYHFLAPSVLYDQNETAPPGAFATDLKNATTKWAYWRETHSAIPMIMVQDQATGSALSLARTGPISSGQLTASSNIDENDVNWLIDGSSQYGSLGVEKSDRAGNKNSVLNIGIIYPSFEGDINYLAGSPYKWVRRSDPVLKGLTQSYTVSFDLRPYGTGRTGADFPKAAGETTKLYYDLLRPRIAADHSEAMFSAIIELNKHLFASLGNGDGKTFPGLPFSASVTYSTAPNYDYRFGFTGAQPSIGFQLLRYGVLNSDSDAYSEGMAILNFWATQDLLQMTQNQNLPLTLFSPEKKGDHWQNVGCKVDESEASKINEAPVFIRDFSDGMEDFVNAAIFARQNPAVGPQRTWEKFIESYAAWLLDHQDRSDGEANGSFLRWYNPRTGEPCPTSNDSGEYQVQSRNVTTFPMRFLVQMYFVTGDQKYMQAARRAGAYVLPHLYDRLVFTGGILSNYEDRESGMQALHAALAMYDLEYEQDPRSEATRQWLDAAGIAADYLETWQYAYDIKIQDATSGREFAAYAFSGSRAISLSTTGSVKNSTGDIALSNESFDIFRLHLLTKDRDENYLHFAKQLEFNTKLTTQLVSAGQNFGYAQDGFATEAVTLTSMYFTSTDTPTAWLSWLSRVELDPQQQLEDVFGDQSINKLMKQDPRVLARLNHHVYPAPRSLNWGQF